MPLSIAHRPGNARSDGRRHCCSDRSLAVSDRRQYIRLRMTGDKTMHTSMWFSLDILSARSRHPTAQESLTKCSGGSPVQ